MREGAALARLEANALRAQLVAEQVGDIGRQRHGVVGFRQARPTDAPTVVVGVEIAENLGGRWEDGEGILAQGAFVDDAL
jgi:hypothetical protein